MRSFWSAPAFSPAHLADHGIAAGDTVAILLPNSVQWIETCFAVTRAGAVGVPISYDATEPEIAYRLSDANCRAIVTTAERGDLVAKLQAGAPDLSIVIVTDRGTTSANALRYTNLMAALPKSLPRDPPLMHETAYILYTSGTTGRAKGVQLTVHGMLWIVAACWAPISGLSDRDTVLSPLPLFHSYALNLSVLGILATGATEYIMERFSTNEAVRLLKTGEFTYMPGVPTMFHYLLQGTLGDAGISFPNLRVLLFGRRHHAGDAEPRIRKALRRAAARRLRHHRNLDHGDDELAERRARDGVLRIPGARACRSHRRSGERPGRRRRSGGRTDRARARRHARLSQQAGGNGKALRDGWYHTGDLAKSDENGFLTITGRLKELIIRGGQNIAPAEIEEVVNTFEAVLDCAVVGAPHEHLGEVPVLFVVPRTGKTVETEALLGHCRTHLSAYKVPQTVRLDQEIPRTGSGKIIRYKLREQLDG